MLVTMTGMYQKDSYAARRPRPSSMRAWHVQGWCCWFYTSRCVPSSCLQAKVLGISAGMEQKDSYVACLWPRSSSTVAFTGPVLLVTLHSRCVPFVSPQAHGLRPLGVEESVAALVVDNGVMYMARFARDDAVCAGLPLIVDRLQMLGILVGLDQKDSSQQYSFGFFWEQFLENVSYSAQCVVRQWIQAPVSVLGASEESHTIYLQVDSCISAQCLVRQRIHAHPSDYGGSGVEVAVIAVDIGSGMCKADLLVTLHTALCSLDCRPSSSTMVVVHGWFCW